MEAIAEGMAAGHLAARDAIKARRPELPVGLSLAIVETRCWGHLDRPAHSASRWSADG